MANPKHLQDLFRILGALATNPPSDLTTAIVTAAYIESHLTALIREKMPGLDSALTKRLFDPEDGPIGTLGSKIDMACALAVMNAVHADDARLIGRIRNKFAHNLAVESFDDPQISGLIANLKLPRGVPFNDQYGNPRDPKDVTNREKFFLSGISICGMIAISNDPGIIEKLHEAWLARQAEQAPHSTEIPDQPDKGQ